MKKIDFFSVKVTGDSLCGSCLSYYKFNFNEMKFSDYKTAKLAFHKTVGRFLCSLDSSYYDILYKKESELSDSSMICVIVYKHKLNTLPKSITFTLEKKHILIDNFCFD